MEIASRASNVSDLHRCSPPSSGTGGGFFSQGLRAAVIVDYENMQRVGMGLFHPDQRIHRFRLHPRKLAEQIVLTRNRSIGPRLAVTVLAEVHAFRGMPSPDRQPKAHAKTTAEVNQWVSDDVRVVVRPLKYESQSAVTGRQAWIARENGVDVLCALAVMRLCQTVDLDLVILATHDSDLEPALDEALDLGRTRIETVCWRDSQVKRFQQIRPTRRSIWNTYLDRAAFHASTG